MRRTKRIGALLALACLAWAARAGENATPVQAWTLERSLATADRLPEVAAAAASERAATEEARAAGRFPDPSLTFATHSVSARQSYLLDVPLPWPGRGARVDVARGNVTQAEADRDLARLEARRAIRLAWFELGAAEERARAARERTERVERNASAVDTLFEEGRASRLEQARARGDAALADADAAETEERRAGAESALRLLLALPPDARVATERTQLPASEPLEPVLARALERSPAVRSAAARLETAEASVRLARSERLPGVGIEAGADLDDPTQPGVDKSVGVVLTFPLQAGPRLAVAEAERDRAAAQLEQARRETATAIDGGWHRARAARQRYEKLEADVLPALREAADLTALSYREGRGDLFHVLEAERALFDADAARADALLEWGTSEAEMLAAAGEEEPAP
jgi:cobalt-zinc-cadmium efflux system outer membrane protein